MNLYGKKPLIFFKHLSETNKILKNHQNWLRIVDRRHFQRFQTGFSHPVDPEIRIFFCPWQSTLKSLSLETLFAFLGGLQPSKRGGLDFEISGDSLLCVCIDLPGFSALPGFKAPFYGDGQSALNTGTTVLRLRFISATFRLMGNFWLKQSNFCKKNHPDLRKTCISVWILSFDHSTIFFS